MAARILRSGVWAPGTRLLQRDRRRSGVDPYAVDGFSPALVFDPANDYYRQNGSAVDVAGFFSVIDRSGLATTVDSDGVRKWAAHNLSTYSEDLSFAWSFTNATRNTETTFTFDTDAGYVRKTVGSGLASTTYTLDIWLSGSHPGDSFFIELVDGADGSPAVGTTVVVPASETKFTLSADLSAGFSGNLLVAINRGATGRSITPGSTITIARCAVYRSDLGGMVNNPEWDGTTGLEKYVPTGSAAVYKARWHDHVDEDGAWVDKGLLVEPSATNLLLNSGTLSTQGVTTTAQDYTLHFTGTGSVTLSGTATDGPLVGTGTGEANRVSLTFTATAGTLTLTVSGTVTNAQLDAGDGLTSYIPTAGSTVVRAADAAPQIAGADHGITGGAYSIVMQFRFGPGSSGLFFLHSLRASGTERSSSYAAIPVTSVTAQEVDPTLTTAASAAFSALSYGDVLKTAARYAPGANGMQMAVDGVAGSAATGQRNTDYSATPLHLLQFATGAGRAYGNLTYFAVFNGNLGESGIKEAWA